MNYDSVIQSTPTISITLLTVTAEVERLKHYRVNLEGLGSTRKALEEVRGIRKPTLTPTFSISGLHHR